MIKWQNFPKYLFSWKKFLETQKRVRISYGKRAIRVRAIEVLLYILNVSQYFTTVQIILLFSLGSLSLSGYFESRIPLKPVLGLHIEPRKLHSCIWRGLIKPSPRCPFFVRAICSLSVLFVLCSCYLFFVRAICSLSVLFDSKGNLLDFILLGGLCHSTDCDRPKLW